MIIQLYDPSNNNFYGILFQMYQLYIFHINASIHDISVAPYIYSNSIIAKCVSATNICSNCSDKLQHVPFIFMKVINILWTVAEQFTTDYYSIFKASNTNTAFFAINTFPPDDGNKKLPLIHQYISV